MRTQRVDERVRELIRELARPSFKSAPLPDELEILGNGLRFDSIDYAELLLGCEEQFGISFPQSWLSRNRLTIGELVTFLKNAEGA
jgi:acyl carrier protein